VKNILGYRSTTCGMEARRFNMRQRSFIRDYKKKRHESEEGRGGKKAEWSNKGYVGKSEIREAGATNRLGAKVEKRVAAGLPNAVQTQSTAI